MPTASVVDWAFKHTFNIVVIVAGATIIVRTSRALIARLQRRLGYGHSDRDLE